MTTYRLRLVEDRLPALPPGTAPGSAAPAELPAANRIVYVVEGSVTLSHPRGTRTVLADDAWVGAAPLGLVAGPGGAVVYRFELVGAPEPDSGMLAREPIGTESLQLLSHPVELDPATGWLLRCDRVDFPRGGIAYTHVHQGPGIRCCLKGEIRVESGGHSQTMRAGEPWFESGPEPVIAFTSSTVETAFVRGFVLPRRLQGKSSIRYVLPEDKDKPKPQRYRIYGEEFVEL